MRCTAFSIQFSFLNHSTKRWQKQNMYHFAGCEKYAFMNSCFQNLKIHFNGSLNLYLSRLNFFVHLHAKNRIFNFTIKMWPNEFSSLKNDVLRFYWWLSFFPKDISDKAQGSNQRFALTLFDVIFFYTCVFLA